MTRIVIAIAVVALLQPALVWAQTEGVIKAPASFDVEAVDEFVARHVREKGFVGLSLVVVRDGKTVFAKGYGKTSVDGGVPVGIDMPFAVGSITKQFTCACILLLAEEGKLSVRDPVSKYYPDLTRAKDITLFDLMSHAAGYPDYYPLDFLDSRMRRPIAPDELIKEYAGGKLDFEPGSRWSYSNTGYILLGRVVEKVAGEPFGRFLERRILKPLGMEHSVFDPSRDRKDLPQGHSSFALGATEVIPQESAGWLHAAGGLYASAPDLARWDVALMIGNVLKPESYQLMMTPRGFSSGKATDYGCGLAVARQSGETVVSHRGAISGFHAYNATIPRTKSAVILCSNAEHVDDGGLHREVLDLFLKDQAKRETAIPTIAGLTTVEAARAMFRQLQTGDLERAKLGEEFNIYMSADRVREAAARLKSLGEPTDVEMERIGERGGMEAARVRFTFKSGAIRANMARSPDGKIQQFLLSKQ